MPIRHPCFISYRHSESRIVQTFVTQIRNALRDSIGGYVQPSTPYMDDALEPGDYFDASLAKNLCESACFVVIYMPPYEMSEYCLREYAAMERLERHRLKCLKGKTDATLSMIVPIVLRKPLGALPNQIGKFSRHIHFADFSKFTLATQEVAYNPEYVDRMEAIAKHIAKVYGFLKEAEDEICRPCSQFQFPAPEQVEPWSTPAAPAFPFRSESGGGE